MPNGQGVPEPGGPTGRLLTAYCREAGVAPAILERPGITVAAEAERAGTGLVSAYRLDQHLLLRCDPATAERCRSTFEPGGEPTLDYFEAMVPGRPEALGRGFVHVLSVVPPAASVPMRVFDPADRQDRALIAALAEADPDGADDAEIELENLDDRIVGVMVDEMLAAYASAHPWESDPDFADIGVLTHPAHRGRGFGASVVAGLCHRLGAEGLLPLYRCNRANRPSKALADRIGFVEVASLSAVRY